MNTKNRTETDSITVKVWDLPVRIFHWLLTVLIVVMFVSAKLENFYIHILAGKGVVMLLVARIIWGFWGSSNARFSALVFKPREYIDYISKLAERKPGYSVAHSPIGSLAVIAILVAIALQAAAGLVATDVDGLIEGPFAYYVNYEFSRWASDFHVTHQKWVFTLVIVHLLANAFYYFYKKDNLIGPMLTGTRRIPGHLTQTAPRIEATWKAVVIALITASILIWLFVQFG